MADLQASLLVPKGSKESFHSSAEYPSPSSHALPPANQDLATPQPSSQSQLPAFHSTGLPGLSLYSLDAYLAAPENAALLRRAPDRKNAPAKQPKPEVDPFQPVLLGSKSGHYVPALNMLCQKNGLVPDYQIDGDCSMADFGGLLKIGDVTIASDERWHSKKQAKDALAQMGVEYMKSEAAKAKETGTPGDKDRNWIGILIAYHQSVDSQKGPVYADYALGSSFSSTCTIPCRLDQPFGSSTAPFPSKKAARAHSARLAVEYLIDKDELNRDGSLKGRKKVKLGSAVKIKQGKNALAVNRESTYTQKVNDAHAILGLTNLKFVLEAASNLTPNILNGYATFPNEPELPQQIGEVRNVFGKKNAKEEIAKGVWEMLMRLAEKRGVSISEIDGGSKDG